MTGAEVHKALVAAGVTQLYHANTVTTACTFLSLAGLASRGYVERKGLAQTKQYTDADDKVYGIWQDVFTDGVDVHARGGRKNGANQYGPISFRLPVGCLLRLPVATDVMVMKKNPANWKTSDKAGDRYFLTPADLQSFYSFGTFAQHVVFRVPEGILPFPTDSVEVLLDDPQRKLQSGANAFLDAQTRLNAAAKTRGLTVSYLAPTCPWDCVCRANYLKSNKIDDLF